MTPHPAKWLYYPGAKDRLVGAISSLLAQRNSQRLIEPFGGSAVVSSALAFKFRNLEIGDANPDLIRAHEMAAKNPEGLVKALAPVFVPGTNNEPVYNAIKDRYNASQDKDERALLLVWLNRHGFHGLMRYNRDAAFNVSFHHGKDGSKRPDEAPEAEIREFSRRLAKARFSSGDFRTMCERAGKGDTLYLDPPYLPEEGKKDSFTAYSTPFTEDDHLDLARLAYEAGQRGAVVILSNHDSRLTREIYGTADAFHRMDVRRSIGAGTSSGENTKSKSSSKEILALWTPHKGRLGSLPVTAFSFPRKGIGPLNAKFVLDSKIETAVHIIERRLPSPEEGLRGFEHPEDQEALLGAIERRQSELREQVKGRALERIAKAAKGARLSFKEIAEHLGKQRRG